MRLQTAPQRELYATNFALKPQLANVRPHVRTHIAALREAHLTYAAHKGFFPGVSTKVNFQVACGRKLLFTHLACIRFFIRMDPSYMSFKTRAVSEWGLAYMTCIRFFPSVSTNVIL